MLLPRIFVPRETKICELAMLTSRILEPVSVVLSVQYFYTFFFFFEDMGSLNDFKAIVKIETQRRLKQNVSFNGVLLI